MAKPSSNPGQGQGQGRQDVHIFLHVDSVAADGKVSQIEIALEAIMKTLDEVLAAVQDESTKEDSLIALVAGLKQQVADVLSGASLPPATQAKVDAVFDAVSANSAKVQAAVDANTTPA